MKNQIKTVLFACGLCLSVFIALPASAQFSAGITAGANLATQTPTTYYHVFLARPVAGLFAQYNFVPAFDVQLGANYSGEGVNLKDLSTGDKDQGRLAYLNIPLFAQYRFPFGGYVELGPQFGFLLSAKDNVDGESNVDVKSFYKSTDIKGGVGLGYEFTHNSLKGLGVEFRYLRSLSSIDKDATDDENVRNRIFSIALTYRLSGK
jgi:hypothetical protein